MLTHIIEGALLLVPSYFVAGWILKPRVWPDFGNDDPRLADVLKGGDARLNYQRGGSRAKPGASVVIAHSHKDAL